MSYIKAEREAFISRMRGDGWPSTLRQRDRAAIVEVLRFVVEERDDAIAAKERAERENGQLRMEAATQTSIARKRGESLRATGKGNERLRTERDEARAKLAEATGHLALLVRMVIHERENGRTERGMSTALMFAKRFLASTETEPG